MLDNLAEIKITQMELCHRNLKIHKYFVNNDSRLLRMKNSDLLKKFKKKANLKFHKAKKNIALADVGNIFWVKILNIDALREINEIKEKLLVSKKIFLTCTT